MTEDSSGTNDAADVPPGRTLPFSQAATLRVAVFHCGDVELVPAVVDAGLEVAYLYDADFGTENLIFEDIPPFDLVAASLPDSEPERKQAFELVLLFLRARTPVSFVLVGGDFDKIEFLASVRERAAGLGYRVGNISFTGRNGDMVVGTLDGSSFVWPPGIVTRRYPTEGTEGDNAHSYAESLSNMELIAMLSIPKYKQPYEEVLHDLLGYGFPPQEAAGVVQRLRAEEEEGRRWEAMTPEELDVMGTEDGETST